ILLEMDCDKAKGFVAGRAGCPDKTKTEGFGSIQPSPSGLRLGDAHRVRPLDRATSPLIATFLVDRLPRRQTEWFNITMKRSRSGIWGWMLFDWAAQPFFTVVTTFIFGPYFVSRMASDPVTGQAAWGYGIAAAGFVIAVLSPVLGSIADQTGPRKPWIAFFAAIKIASLCLLWFAAPGSSLFWVVA